jgi:hypothetical protein
VLNGHHTCVYAAVISDVISHQGFVDTCVVVPASCTTRAVPLNAVKVGVLNGHHTCGSPISDVIRHQGFDSKSVVPGSWTAWAVDVGVLNGQHTFGSHQGFVDGLDQRCFVQICAVPGSWTAWAVNVGEPQ